MNLTHVNPLETVVRIEFNPDLKGRAVYVEGYDENGDDRTGVYLVMSVKFDEMRAIDDEGRWVNFYSEQFEVKKPDYESLMEMRVLQ